MMTATYAQECPIEPADEEMLHAFYGCDTAALERLAERQNPLLARIAYMILRARTGSAAQALGEWDIDERLVSLWAHVLATKMTGLAPWPHQRLSALTWLIHLLCLEMDRHLGLRGPF
jgi:hypothetical protein